MDETILLNYLQGECNDEEAARVETWCEEEPGNRKTLEQLYYTLFVGERIAVMNAVDTEASLDKFKSAIREKAVALIGDGYLASSQEVPA